MKVLSFILLSLLLTYNAFAEAPTVSLDAQKMPIAQAAEAISKQAAVPIIVNDGVTGTVTAQLGDVGIEQMLDIITKSNNLKWQKLMAAPGEDGRISTSSVKAQLKALAALQDTTLVVYDPVTKKQTVYARVDTSAPDKAIDTSKLGLKEVYFISDPAAEVADANSALDKLKAVDKMKELTKQRLDTFMKMSPDEQKVAAEQDMLSVLNLSPDQQKQYLQSQRDARRNADPVIRDQFRNMRQTLFPGGGRGGRRGGGGGGGQNPGN